MSLGKILSFGLESEIAGELVEGQSLTGDPRARLLNVQNRLMEIVRNHVQEINAIIANPDIVLSAKNTRAAASVERSLTAVRGVRTGADFSALDRERGEAAAAVEKARREIANSVSEAGAIEIRAIIRGMDETGRAQLLNDPESDDGRLLGALVSAPSFETLVPAPILEDAVQAWFAEHKPDVVGRFELATRLYDTAVFNIDEVENALKEPLDVLSGNKLGTEFRQSTASFDSAVA